MKRLGHALVRIFYGGWVLGPMWLSYVVPWVRMRRFGATIAPEVWSAKHRKHSKRFYRLAVRLRGGLIKVGQILSTRVDLLPVEWTSELASLQDEVEPLPWAHVEQRLAEEYGKDPSELFAELGHEAVAAASFGQVHRGVTKDGVDVALKVKYPDVESKLAIDMVLFSIAVRLFGVFLPRVNLRGIYVEIRRALTTELDYRQEARFTRIISSNFEGRDCATVPAVIDELTTESLICTTWFEGHKITSPAVLDHPALDRKVLLEKLLFTWVQMMYVDGVFQSDPHPGNLLVRVDDDGEPHFCVVDFGQVKILSQEFHQKLVRSAMAVSMGNASMCVTSLIDLGLFEESERERMEPLVEALLERLKGSRMNDPDPLDFRRLRADVLATLDQMEGVVIPQELVLYGRTFALLAGVTRAVAPDINALAIARPLLTQALLAGGPPERPDEAADAAAAG